MKLYKLTEQDGTTYKGTCQWGENVTHTADGKGELCTEHWLHAYTHPILAILLNPMHADIRKPKLWEAKGRIGKTDRGLKVGTRKLTTTKELPVPKVTTEQRIRFAIGCGLAVCKDEQWQRWAMGWLDGTDRTYAAARAAYAAADAVYAADAAARAAYAAARAVDAAADAAYTARAACAAADAAADIDLIAIAEWAMTDKPWEELMNEEVEK
jgi:hypothetical protein